MWRTYLAGGAGVLGLGLSFVTQFGLLLVGGALAYMGYKLYQYQTDPSLAYKNVAINEYMVLSIDDGDVKIMFSNGVITSGKKEEIKNFNINNINDSEIMPIKKVESNNEVRSARKLKIPTKKSQNSNEGAKYEETNFAQLQTKQTKASGDINFVLNSQSYK
jgi:hypothetical protein